MPAYSPGEKLSGRYTIGRYLDEGGMQEVYVAHDGLLRREVAVKVPMTSSAKRRFHRSAIASARVNHPNVTRTLDHFIHNGREHLAEEFVAGMNLGELLKKIPKLDPYAVAHILHGLAEGVRAVHAQVVIHRDLKPSNVMVEGGLGVRAIKITDFGIAQMAGTEIAEAVKGGAMTITASKSAVALIPYMAPEVILEPEKASTTSDIWALGAIAYELLSGEKPFGQGYAAIPKILEAASPKIPNDVTINPQYSVLGKEIFGIILRCLGKDKERRPTASELVKLCERLCYPPMHREVGIVTNYPAQTFGFLQAESDKSTVFFHTDSVYGSRPRVFSQVWFTRHKGSPRDRAHPVVPLRNEE